MILHFKHPNPTGDDASVYNALAPSTFRSDSWREVLELIHEKFGAFICLLLLDESRASLQLRRLIENRYVDLDRITGRDLILVSDIRPPEHWFAARLEVYSGLPAELQELLREDHQKLQEKLGREDSRINAQKLMGEYFEGNQRFPLLCFIQPRPDSDGNCELDARAVDFSAFQTEQQVFTAFEELSERAAKRKVRGGDAIDLAEDAFSAVPFSLRWKGALYRSWSVVRFVENMCERAKALF